MKIKKFNENIDIDPYGEENWNESDEKPDYSHQSGVCYNCGSQNISWGDSETYDDSIGYKYTCNLCDAEGQEIYLLHFLINEAD